MAFTADFKLKDILGGLQSTKLSVMRSIGQESGPQSLDGIAGYYHGPVPNGLPRSSKVRNPCCHTCSSMKRKFEFYWEEDGCGVTLVCLLFGRARQDLYFYRAGLSAGIRSQPRAGPSRLLGFSKFHERRFCHACSFARRISHITFTMASP